MNVKILLKSLNNKNQYQINLLNINDDGIFQNI